MREGSPAQNPNGEKEPVKLTLEELDKYTSLDLDSPEFIGWMASKGLEFGDDGADEIDVIVDGKNRKMVVSKNDFGTLLPEPWRGPNGK